MSGRRKILFITVVIFQAAILLSMIARQEILLRSGTKIMLRCVPVDPRSLFSGDYVHLNYEISEINPGNDEAMREKIASFSRNDTIYVSLARSRGERFHSITGFARTTVELKKPYEAVLKGTVDEAYSSLRIRYGLETYFVPQNEGKEIETNMAEVSAEVSAAEDGRSALSRLFISGKEVRFY